MRAVLVSSCCLAIAIVIATVSTSRGEGETETAATDPMDETTEPITGAAVMPRTGNETPPRDPFTPYAAPDPWRYEDLAADERAVADQGLNEDQSKVQDAYAAAAKNIAIRAKSDSAAIQLGVDNLDTVGVVGDEERAAP